jgi:hypothetical protein
MASGLWTLCAVLDLGEIAEAKAPVKICCRKPADKDGAKFLTRIASRADKLVGRYGWNEHQAYLAQLPNSRLNCVFEVPDIEYPARPVHEAPDSAKASKKRKLEVVESRQARGCFEREENKHEE